MGNLALVLSLVLSLSACATPSSTVRVPTPDTYILNGIETDPQQIECRYLTQLECQILIWHATGALDKE